MPYFLDVEIEITQSKDPERSKEFWSKLAFEVESCDEATQMFPDMLKCPVCMSELELRDGSSGYMMHKSLEALFN